MDSIFQRRGGQVLCEVPLAGFRSVRWHPGADQTTTAFVFAASNRPTLTRDDAAIAAGWAARIVRKLHGADAVATYDESGAWTPRMEEVFAYGFVAYLRTAAWNPSWPRALDWWRPQIAGMIAACPAGDEPADIAERLDDAMGALYGRLVMLADARGALPFPAPEPPPAGFANDTTAAPDGRVRRRSMVVGEAADVPAENTPAADSTYSGAMFSDLEQAAPRRLGPAVAIVGLGLVVVAAVVVGMYFTVLRPGERAAVRAAATTVDQLKELKLSRMYDTASANFRREKWTDFTIRAKDLPALGKMTTTTLSPAKIERDPALGRSATVTCEAECVFGHATIVCRYADVGFSGEWLLADLQVDVKPELVEPPYPATDDGADQLARRFVYAFQNSDFATVNALVPNTSDAEKLASFRESLIGDGLVTVLKRSSIETREINGANVRAAAYDIETSRERRAGTVTFYVVDADGQWRVLGVETSMRFAR